MDCVVFKISPTKVMIFDILSLTSSSFSLVFMALVLRVKDSLYMLWIRDHRSNMPLALTPFTRHGAS